MNQVSFDPSFLTSKVKKDYSDHKVALVREFLQNSIDAGANKVEFQFDPDKRTLVVTDNGCGMSPEVMETALFKIGGSHKKENSVGGFGSAKLILYFQHDSFQIISRHEGTEWFVEGQGCHYNDYENRGATTESGVVAKIVFSDTWAIESSYNGETYDTFHNFEQDALRFLSYCDVPAQIVWNGKTVQPMQNGELVRELDWCKIYSRPEPGQNYIHVRIKGIKMFEVWNSNLEQFAVLELSSKSSLDILTTNRDGLRYEYQNELGAIVEEMSVDKNSFKHKKGQQFIYNGSKKSTFAVLIDTVNALKLNLKKHLEFKKNQAYATKDMERYSSLMQDIDSVESIENQNELSHMLEQAKTATVATDAFVEVLKKKFAIAGFKTDSIINKNMEKLNAKTEHDFVVMYEKNSDKLAPNMDPAKGLSPKYEKIAKVYLYSLKYILDRTKNETPFRIGWVISDNALAMFSKKEGDVAFLINPEKIGFTTGERRKCLKRIFRIACHEITHMMGFDYHNEQFMLKYDQLIEMEDDITNWIDFEKEALKEVL
jgi:hypothetical protein